MEVVERRPSCTEEAIQLGRLEAAFRDGAKHKEVPKYRRDTCRVNTGSGCVLQLENDNTHRETCPVLWLLADNKIRGARRTLQ